MDPDIYSPGDRSGLPLAYPGSPDWIEQHADGWVRVRPSLITILELIECEHTIEVVPVLRGTFSRCGNEVKAA